VIRDHIGFVSLLTLRSAVNDQSSPHPRHLPATSPWPLPSRHFSQGPENPRTVDGRSRPRSLNPPDMLASTDRQEHLPPARYIGARADHHQTLGAPIESQFHPPRSPCRLRNHSDRQGPRTTTTAQMLEQARRLTKTTPTWNTCRAPHPATGHRPPPPTTWSCHQANAGIQADTNELRDHIATSTTSSPLSNYFIGSRTVSTSPCDCQYVSVFDTLSMASTK